MVSPELIRRYPFFSNFTLEQIVFLAKVAEEKSVQIDHYFSHEGEELDTLYLILEGEISAIITLPQDNREVTLNTLGPDEIFGWSSLVPPYTANIGTKTVVPSRVVAFDARELRKIFNEDHHFGYLMMIKIAQLIKSQLDALRIETLAYTSKH
jgi:CRP-like cAMP-binding protein